MTKLIRSVLLSAAARRAAPVIRLRRRSRHRLRARRHRRISAPNLPADADAEPFPDANAVGRRLRASPTSTPTHQRAARQHAAGDRSRFQRRIDQRPGQAALQPDDHQPRARHRAARHQRAGQLRRLRQRVRFGGIVLGRHSRPQEPDPQSVAARRHRLHPLQRRRLQRHQRADRRVRAALRFHRLGIVAAVLRHRHHPDAVREGPLRAQLRDEPRRGVGRRPDHRRELRRLWPRGLDQPAVAARRGRGLRRGLAVVAAGEGLHRSRRRLQSVRRHDRHRHRQDHPGQDRRTMDASVRQQASRPTSTAASCNRSAPDPASSPP